MIEDIDGELIKIQIPEGLVESGIKPEDANVERYVKVPLKDEDRELIESR